MNDQERPSINVRGHWLRLRRYRWWVLTFTFTGWLLATSASWVLPPKYRSETVILIEQQKIPQHYVEPNIASDLNYRLQSMSEQILSRTRLLAIIQSFQLYAQDGSRQDPDAQVADMRKNVKIEMVRTRRDEFSAFKIAFTDSNPVVAQKVTGELTSLFINENLRSRAQLSEDTTAFLENQLEAARVSLDVQEQRLREFRSSHLGQLPEQLQGNVQILGGLQSQLQAATDALHRAEQQRLFLQYQHRALAGSSTKTGEPGQPTSLPALERKLEGLRSQLAELTANYTAQHPDVVKVRTEVAATEAAKARMLERLKSTPDPESGNSSLAGDTSKGTLLEGEQKANELEIANASAKIRRLEAQIDEYRGRLNSAPVREQQLVAITRDYEQSRTYYESLLAKKLQSEMATNLEKRQQGEQFRMIDPPNLPHKPYWPNRLAFSLGGLAAGLALGLGLVLLLEFANPRIYQDQELRNIEGLSVLVSVPTILTAAEQRQVSWRWGLEAVAASAMLTVVCAGTLLVYYKG